MPKSLVAVRNQKYAREGKKYTVPVQFLPKGAHAAFIKLNAAMKKEIGKSILVDSAYRSPANQAIVFLTYFEKHGWNAARAAKRVAIPGYSEHGDPTHVALDLLTKEGIPNNDKPLLFAKTEEYKWLLKRAKEFGFTLSYPKGNKQGIMFEPWHWRYTK